MQKWLFWIFILVSCSNNKTSNDETVTNLQDNDSIDNSSPFTLIPLTKADSNRFLKVSKEHSDTTQWKYHKLIWDIKYVENITTNRVSTIDLWYTQQIAETDSIVNLGLYFIWKPKKAHIERYRFRINKKTIHIQVTNIPTLDEYYIDLSEWETQQMKPMDE